MELDELKALWQQTDRGLAALELPLRASLRLARGGLLDRLRTRLRFVQVVLWSEVAFAVVVLLWLGSYLFENVAVSYTPRFALPAVAMHLGAIFLLAFAAGQLVALHRIDYAGPVLHIQRRLAELGLVRARANRWLLLSSPLIWATFIVVVPYAVIGLDVYRAFGVPWVAGNFAVGIAALAGAAWASRRFPASRFLRWLGEDVTGGKVAAAAAFLDDLAEFETEQ